MRKRGGGGAYTDVVHHHLVETAGAKRALDDICDGLRSQNCLVLAICCPILALQMEHTVLVSNIGTRNLLATQEKGAIAGLLKHGRHGCGCSVGRADCAVLRRSECEDGVAWVEDFCLPLDFRAAAKSGKLSHRLVMCPSIFLPGGSHCSSADSAPGAWGKGPTFQAHITARLAFKRPGPLSSRPVP